MTEELKQALRELIAAQKQAYNAKRRVEQAGCSVCEFVYNDGIQLMNVRTLGLPLTWTEREFGWDPWEASVDFEGTKLYSIHRTQEEEI